MPSQVNSVHGQINVDDLGVTLMHEHIVSVNWNMRHCYPSWFDRNEFIDFAVHDIALAQKVGIKTLVDATPVCLGRDIRLVKEVADRSGVQVIASTGFFHTEQQWMYFRETESFLRYMTMDIEQGIDGTDIKPAFIKCCSDKQGVTPINRRLLDASAMAATKSGLPIMTHSSWQNKTGLEQARIFEKHGVDMSKVIIGHLGDTNDMDYLEQVLEFDCYIGLDRFGDDTKNPLEHRVNTLAKLCDAGYINQLIVSHDHVCYVDIGNNEWHTTRETNPADHPYNFSYFHTYALPLLKEKGFAQKEIDQLLIENPKSYFSK